MEYVIAIYRSRNVTIQVYNYLLKSGVTCALISTPRSANVGCGLSVKFGKDALPRVRYALQQGETFVGFYLARQNYGGTTITRI